MPAANPPPRQPPVSTAQGGHSKLVKCSAILLLSLIVITCLVIVIVWLAVHPRRLVFNVQSVYVHDYNLSHNRLNATFDLILESVNRNRHVSVYYDSAELWVLYSDQILAMESIPPFHQPHKNVTLLDVKPVARDVLLHNIVSRNLRIERTSGTVDMEVRVRAKVRFKLGVWKSRHRTLKINCSPVLGFFTHSKNFVSSKCEVHT